MGEAFLYGNGGALLNFKVVGGTAQPTTNFENTIWINTDTKIANYVFSASEPTEPVDGAVWICTGIASVAPINIFKNNSLIVYPILARQYVSGAWINVIGHCYQNGEWVQFSNLDMVEYLIKDGVIDMEAHEHTGTVHSGSQCLAKNAQTYSGKPALQLQQQNGKAITHSFANVTVPVWAKTFKIECYLIACYNGFDPSFTLGTQTVTLENSSNTLKDTIVSIDVSSLAGTSNTLSIVCNGYADAYYTYIGNAWFEV